jgi:hypothetical protein
MFGPDCSFVLSRDVHDLVRDDPCRLVRQVKKIPLLETAANNRKTPASLSGR